MKKRLWIALIGAALLCLLCGAALATPSDDGCWEIVAGTQPDTVYLTGFYPEADIAHRYLVVYDRLVFPDTVIVGGVTNTVEGVWNFGISSALDPGIKRVILSEGITEIGDLGFSSCRNLESIQLPSTIRKIANRSFANCSSLKEVNIPYSIDETGIGNLDYFGKSLFVNTQGLHVRFGNTFQEWKNLTFQDTEYIKNAPGLCVETTDGYSFGWCGDRLGVSNGSTRTWQLTPEGVLTCGGAGAIVSPGWDAEAVRSVSMVTEWDDLSGLAAENGIFDQMIGLTAIALNSGDKYFTLGGLLYGKVYGDGGRAIDSLVYCPRGYIGVAELPSSLTDLDLSKFSGRPGVTGLSVEQGNEVFFARDGILYKWTEEGKAEMIFVPSSCSGLVQIPASVRGIDPEMFAGRGGITGFTVEEGNPEYSAAEGLLLNRDGNTIILCPPGLKNITIPTGVNTWTGWTFRLISGAFTITLQNGLTAIPASAFAGCSGLISVTIPDSVKQIGLNAFANCTGLTAVTIPDSVTELGEYAFYGCTGLTAVTIPDSVATIGEGTFENCTGLTIIALPFSVTSIRNRAFGNCTGLTVLYYNGTSSQWAAVEKDDSAIPVNCSVLTLDDQTSFATVSLAGLTKSDSVTLTDELGTNRTITASGNHTFWNQGAKITVIPGAGRRVTYSLSYLCTEGEAVYVQPTAGGTFSASATVPLNLGIGVPTITISFEADEGYAAYHLFVNENSLDQASGLWSLTSADHTESSYQNGDTVLVDQGGMGQSRNFTLMLVPQGITFGCVGELVYGSHRIALSDRTGTYSFSLAGADIHLSLTWFESAKHYTVAYDGNGSEGSTPTQVVAAGASAILRENQFDGRSGSDWLIFDGWNRKADGTGQNYEPGDIVFGSMVLYARWIPAWGLQLRGNGGEGSMDPILRPKTDAGVTIPPCEFTCPGKALKEWNTKSKGTGTSYQPGDTVTLTGNMTLYAIWEDAWTVAAEADPVSGGTVTGTGTYLPDTPVTLTAVPAEHYRFDHWQDENGGNVSTEPAYTFTPEADCRLTACFARSDYAITAQYCSVTVSGESAQAAFAAPGTRLWIGWDYENQPEGMYWTGRFRVNGEELPEGEYEFTMPEQDVIVTAVYLPQETVTVELSAGVQAVPGEALYACGEMQLVEQREFYLMDLNGDEISDLKLVPREEGGEMLVSPLSGMKLLAPSVTKDISAEHGQYAAVVFRFNPLPFVGQGASETTLVLPSGLNLIEDSAFEGDTAVTGVDAGHCAAIGAAAFRGCTGLSKIRVSGNCRIEESAFDGCTALYALYGPASGTVQEWAESHFILFIEE